MQRLDIFGMDFLIVPIHGHVHWSVMIIRHGATRDDPRRPSGCMWHFDSLGGMPCPTRRSDTPVCRVLRRTCLLPCSSPQSFCKSGVYAGCGATTDCSQMVMWPDSSVCDAGVSGHDTGSLMRTLSNYLSLEWERLVLSHIRSVPLELYTLFARLDCQQVFLCVDVCAM